MTTKLISTALALGLSTPVFASDWRSETETNPVYGTTTVWSQLDHEQPTGNKPSSIVIGCVAGASPFVSVDSNGEWGASGQEVIIGFRTTQPESELFQVTAVLEENGSLAQLSDVPLLAKSLHQIFTSSDGLHVSVRDADGHENFSTFQLPGDFKHLDDVAEFCGVQEL